MIRASITLPPASRNSRPVQSLLKHTNAVTAVAWASEDHFLSASHDTNVFFWSVAGEHLRTFSFQSRLSDIAVNFDRTLLLMVNAERDIKVVDDFFRRLYSEATSLLLMVKNVESGIKVVFRMDGK